MNYFFSPDFIFIISRRCSSATTRSTSTCCARRPACRSSSRRCRSAARSSLGRRLCRQSAAGAAAAAEHAGRTDRGQGAGGDTQEGTVDADGDHQPAERDRLPERAGRRIGCATAGGAGHQLRRARRPAGPANLLEVQR